jgi:catechol 2,3-dioxygenase-like lactoylglutathione lyase family enzyme
MKLATTLEPSRTEKIAMRVVCAAITMLLCCSGVGTQQLTRPKIVGIGSVRIQSSSVDGNAIGFYIKDLGFGAGNTVCKGASNLCLEVNKHQRIDLRVPKQSGVTGELAEITLATSDVPQLRDYLIAHDITVSSTITTPESSLYFGLNDPEGHRIGFIQYTAHDDFSRPENQVSSHLIHAGFVVRDRAAMDKFYKDILGFHVYWHGGMKDDQTNWVDMQVPDGTDWIEYMLDVPANADQRTLGVMNHIALGVPDIHAAYKQLLTNGMQLTEEPKIGRDGKWQLNLYDPDQTRVELMEFTPVEKPCCSEYTGPHPKP